VEKEEALSEKAAAAAYGENSRDPFYFVNLIIVSAVVAAGWSNVTRL